MEKIAGLIIAICWLIFLGYWCVSAFVVKRTAERKSLSSALAYRLPLILGAVLIWGSGVSHRWNTHSFSDARHAIAAIVCICGLILAIWARRTLAGNWSSSVTFKQGHELIRSGPYRFVRHPIYSGILLMLLGLVIQIGRLHGLLGFAVMFVGFWIKLKQEEQLMLQHFPDQYPLYCKEVKALVPWVL
jgi:protein-S-isoprenylcysteine O-methyltransferase Ste14